MLDNLSNGLLQFIHKDADFQYCDITKSESYLQKVLKEYGAKYVFSYAAHPYIPISFDRPGHVFDVNATGAMNVITAAHEAGVDGILQVSSAELYGDGKMFSREYGSEGALSEDDPVIPHSSYGASKAAVDFWVQARWREAKVPCIALRQFNCVGERETHPYVVPEIISQLWQQIGLVMRDGTEVPRCDTPTVRLGNNSRRDFMYAGDAVRVAVELLERGQFGEVYNLGSEDSISIYDLAKLIGKVMGFSDTVVQKDEARVRPWEIWHLASSNEKINQAIDTNPLDDLITLEEALRRTVAWFHQNGGKWPWQ